MPRAKTEVERSLKKKGFQESSGHHTFFIYHMMNGKKSSFRTKKSHTPKMKEIPDNIIGQMAKQCGLDKAQFLSLVDCPLSREGYEELIAPTPSDAGDEGDDGS